MVCGGLRYFDGASSSHNSVSGRNVSTRVVNLGTTTKLC